MFNLFLVFCLLNTQYSVFDLSTEVKIPQMNTLKETIFYESLSNTRLTLAKNLQTKDYFISSNSKVLLIGDSHTVGFYGRKIDELLRSTGAKVQTYGSSGSSPSWWIEGKETKSGFYSKDDFEKVYDPSDWKTPHKTPLIKDILDSFEPNIVIISLGANLINSTEDVIDNEVLNLCKLLKKSDAKIVWVGPPNGRSDKKPEAKQNLLYDHLKKITANYAFFIDSRPYTFYPQSLKGDGVHFWGKEGKKIAQNWAENIFKEIQKL